MQLCALGNSGDSLGSSAPLVFASPSSKQKLLLLERRLTGSHTGPHLQPAAGSCDTMPEDGAAAGHSTAAQGQPSSQHTTSDMELEPAAARPVAEQQQQQQQHDPAAASVATPDVGRKSNSGGGASGGGPADSAAAAPLASASKRRKTGRPQYRPATADATSAAAAAAAGQPDVGSKAGGGGQAGSTARDTAQRDKTPRRAKASPPPPPPAAAAAAAGARGEGRGTDAGSSNPPLSPVGAAAGVASRTPRSSSKQQQQQHSRGQTNINKFFPLLLDGSSRDSDTPPALQQQQQQQQQPSPQVLLHMSPIEGLVDNPAAAAATAWQEAAPATTASAQAAAAAQPKPAQQPAGGGGSSGSSGSSKGVAHGSGQQPAAAAAALQQQLAVLQQKHQQEVSRLKEAARLREAQLSESLTSQQRQVEQLSGLLGQLQQELTHTRVSSEEREGAVCAAVSSLVVSLGVSEGQLCRLSLALEGGRLGCLGVSRAGPLGLTEVWEDGPVFRDLAGRQAALRRMRDELEAARKALKRRLPPPPRASAAAAADAESGAGSQQQYISSAEYVMQDEILKVRLSVLRCDEEALGREEERLTAEKMRHLRSLKRLRDEESSRFSGQPTLALRYVLLGLLGRGGFSEVHKAYDLAGLTFVAVKLHQLNSGWSEARKASYVRHAVREYTIHKALRHVNIVSLSDIFEVDSTTFATVLELCEGGDLEGYLQQHHVVPEREARALISQVFAGLAYLNRPSGGSSSSGSGIVPEVAGGEPGGGAAGGVGGGGGPRVIHYDLKPANILFDRLGAVKITDFGLSKVVEEGQTMGMELTSQGAGTYWYLPPECFHTAGSSAAAAAAVGSSRAAAAAAAAASSAGVGGLLPPGLLSGGGAAGGAGVAVGGCGGAGVAAEAGPPRISNKVDVWSAGVILYQMLYGRRPFGEGLSQEQIYRDGVMLNARQVQFPSKPAVSAEGRAFLSRCLAYNQADRWDVLTAAADPYLQLKR